MRECWDEKGRSWHRFETGGAHQNRCVARNFRPLRRVNDKEALFAVTQIGVGEAVVVLAARINKQEHLDAKGGVRGHQRRTRARSEKKSNICTMTAHNDGNEDGYKQPGAGIQRDA